MVSTQEDCKEELKKLTARYDEMTLRRDELSAERDALLHDKQSFHVELEGSKCEADKWRTRVSLQSKSLHNATSDMPLLVRLKKLNGW